MNIEKKNKKPVHAIHSNYICNSPKLENNPHVHHYVTRLKTMVFLYNRILPCLGKDWTTDMCTTMNEVQKNYTDWKKPNQKSTYYTISLLQNSRKYKWIYSNSKQISGCLGKVRVRNREEKLQRVMRKLLKWWI